MIRIYINGVLRDDVWIQAGGSLEQTEEHMTESSISVQVPVTSDNLSVYDYVQIYEGDIIIFAGNILSLNQQMIESGYTDLDFRIYDLVLACNADLVANILVDMSFPAGATVTQILRGNHAGDSWYDSTLGEFAGVIDVRIIPEGISLGNVDNYSATSLESTAYTWGETVKDFLDNLAELTQSYWEITNEKVFNFRRKSTAPMAPFNLNGSSEIFDLSVENDSLATYSAVRVVGGDGEISIGAASYPSDAFTVENASTMTTTFRLAGMSNIALSVPSNPAADVFMIVGFEGIDDDNPDCVALISYGGSTIKIKDEYKNNFQFHTSGNHPITGLKVLQPVTARVISDPAVERIKAARGGTGIIEYVLEDASIETFNDATLNARSFLRKHENNVQTVKFSTFMPGLCVGQKIAATIPYYKIQGAYYVTAISINFILDSAGTLLCQYDVELSSSLYRDTYKTLFYEPKILSFGIGDDAGNVNSESLVVDLDIIVTIKTQVSDIPTWQEISGTLWSALNGITWEEFYRFTEGETITGNFVTEEARNLLAQIAQGSWWENTSADDARKMAGNLIMANKIYLEGAGTSSFLTDKQEVTPVLGTEYTTTYYVSENDAEFQINQIRMINFFPTGFGDEFTNAIIAPVSIDKSPANPQGEYAMTIGITVNFQ